MLSGASSAYRPKFSSPYPRVQDVPKKPQAEGSSTQELIPSEDEEKQNGMKDAEPPGPPEPAESPGPEPIEGESTRDFRLSSQSTQAADSKDISNNTSSSTYDSGLAEEDENSSHTPTPSQTKKKGVSGRLSRIMPDKMLEKRGSIRSKDGSVVSKHSKDESVVSKRSSQDVSAFTAFRRLCATQGLLKRPEGFGKHDVPEGINDDATLRCVVVTAVKCFIVAWLTL